MTAPAPLAELLRREFSYLASQAPEHLALRPALTVLAGAVTAYADKAYQTAGTQSRTVYEMIRATRASDPTLPAL